MDANSFLMGGASAVKFDDKGDTVTGVIIAEPTIAQQRDFQTGEPAFWDKDKTQPKQQMIVTLRTQERDTSDPDDDGERRLFVASPNMRKAIAAAVREAKRKGLAVGGTLTVTYTADGEKQRGLNPPKLYSAKYVPPAAEEVAVPDAEPEAHVETRTEAAAPAQQAGLTAEQLAALKALGLS